MQTTKQFLMIKALLVLLLFSLSALSVLGQKPANPALLKKYNHAVEIYKEALTLQTDGKAQ